MKISSALTTLLLALSLTGLTACSTTGTSSDTSASGSGAEVTDASAANGAATAGLGQDASFDSGNASDSTNPLKVGDQKYYFDFDKSEVHPADRASLDVQAHYLMAHPNAKVLLEGYTDPRGSREYNIALGERRANAVAAILKMDGVAASQIRVVSYGAEKLASPDHTDAGYALDRRVHLVYEAK